MTHILLCTADGGRILGLGDLGTNGIGISIGKVRFGSAAAFGLGMRCSLKLPVESGMDSPIVCLQISLYVAGAGFHPEHSLPAGGYRRRMPVIRRFKKL